MTVPVKDPIAHHLGYAVHDAEATMQRYTQVLGAKFRLQPIYELQDLYNRPAKLKVYYGAMAGLAIEIIEVVEGVTCHSEWLRQHGDGIQHIGVWVPDVRKATAEAVANGGRVEWIYTDVAGETAALQLTAGSPTNQVLDAVSNAGLTYVDFKEGGTQIEYIGPIVQARIYGEGGPLNGWEDFINLRPPGQKAGD